MALATFYVPDLLDHQDRVCLSEQEVAHALRARRLKNGDELRLFDGQGNVALGCLTVESKRRALVELTSMEAVSRSEPELWIASALPKGDRQRVMIDMLTQLGVTGFIPLVCDRSAVKFQDKMLLKWQRYSIEACKQSHNPYVIECREPQSVTELLENRDNCFYLDQNAQQIDYINEKAMTLMIGPEGGFSDEELSLLTEKSAGSLTLGQHILRTETAAVIAAGTIKANTLSNN